MRLVLLVFVSALSIKKERSVTPDFKVALKQLVTKGSCTVPIWLLFVMKGLDLKQLVAKWILRFLYHDIQRLVLKSDTVLHLKPNMAITRPWNWIHDLTLFSFSSHETPRLACQLTVIQWYSIHVHVPGLQPSLYSEWWSIRVCNSADTCIFNLHYVWITVLLK